jgi:hypothetical protein
MLRQLDADLRRDANPRRCSTLACDFIGDQYAGQHDKRTLVIAGGDPEEPAPLDRVNERKQGFLNQPMTGINRAGVRSGYAERESDALADHARCCLPIGSFME